MRDPDPLVLYTVVRTSLKLVGGKIGAQCQHAYDYLTRHRELLKEKESRTEEEERLLALFAVWRFTPEHAKVVLGASDAQFEQVKREEPLHFVVTDLGFTQVAPNTETCLAL
jgi:peptidyl-tRNA hydrolase